MRLQDLPDTVIVGRYRESDRSPDAGFQQVDVTRHQWGSGQYVDAPSVLPQGLDAASGQLVPMLCRLVGIAYAGEHGGCGLALARKFGPQYLDHNRLCLHKTAPRRTLV